MMKLDNLKYPATQKKQLLLSCRVGVVVCYVHPPGVTALEVSIQGSTVLGSNNMGDHKAQNHSP